MAIDMPSEPPGETEPTRRRRRRKTGGAGPVSLRPGETRPLSDREARELRPGTIDALLGLWPRLDVAVTATTKPIDALRAESFAWRAIDVEQTETVADALLSLGKQHAGLAAIIRGGTLVSGTYSAGAILFAAVARMVLHYVRNGGPVLPNPADLLGIIAP